MTPAAGAATRPSMPWKVGDEVWAVYCDNVAGVGLTYVPGLVGHMLRVERDEFVVRLEKPDHHGNLLARKSALGRAWSAREPCEAWCTERVGPYGPGRGRGSMGVAGNIRDLRSPTDQHTAICQSRSRRGENSSSALSQSALRI